MLHTVREKKWYLHTVSECHTKYLGYLAENIDSFCQLKTLTVFKNHFQINKWNETDWWPLRVKSSTKTFKQLSWVLESLNIHNVYYTCECVDMQDVCLWKCTCLLAVQNFFWKNSSFIWMPTAERETTHSLTRSNGTCVCSVCWSVSALWSLSNRSYPTGKREIVNIHTESKCIFH